MHLSMKVLQSIFLEFIETGISQKVMNQNYCCINFTNSVLNRLCLPNGRNHAIYKSLPSDPGFYSIIQDSKNMYIYHKTKIMAIINLQKSESLTESMCS